MGTVPLRASRLRYKLDAYKSLVKRRSVYLLFVEGCPASAAGAFHADDSIETPLKELLVAEPVDELRVRPGTAEVSHWVRTAVLRHGALRFKIEYHSVS